MYEPKADVYAILSEIEDVTVYQNRPEVLVEFPCITFSVANNIPNLVLEKDIGFQRIVVVIDIYAKTSKESGTLLSTLEEDMREEGHVMVFNSDVPEDDISHITTRFNLLY